MHDVIGSGASETRERDEASDAETVQSKKQIETDLTRRKFLGAAMLAAASAGVAAAQEATTPKRSPDHHLPNEQNHGPVNAPLEAENPSAVWGTETDAGTVPPFKYPFGMARKRIESGGWTRQVTVRELPASKSIAGVEMRLTAGGVRELHWHVSSEWAIMLYGNARITAVDVGGKSFVSDVTVGDLWLFPPGVPHSIQGLGPDGCQFLLVFDDGNFNEFETFLLTDWLTHTPKEVLAKNFGVSEETFDKVPKKELFIFQTGLPEDLKKEESYVAEDTGSAPMRMNFRTSEMKPTKVTAGGEVKIVDARNFPVTTISSAIVKLKPGGLREMHWHPNADEWQYYVSGKGRMTVFAAGGRARTMDVEAGDVGYVQQSNPHYIENTGDTELMFLEMFRTPHYMDISLAEWLAHTPALLVEQHLGVGQEMLKRIAKEEVVARPL
jgi:oxalate decarboxylase